MAPRMDPRVAAAVGAYAPAPKRSKKDDDAIRAYLAKVGRTFSEPVRKYFDRQGMLAREGLAQADMGAQQLRGGDPAGAAHMVLGPLGYLSSPVTALLPTESEVYNAPDLPEDAKPLIAGGLGLAAMMLPGNKKGMGKPSSTVYHGSPTLRNIADFDMNAPRRTDYGYLGDGMYVAPEEFVARGYAGHKGYIHPLEMPQGKFKDFPYVDETYQKSVNEFARSIGVKAEEGTREWAREFSEKMQGLGYVGARGVNTDGSMAEAVIFDPKSAITPEGITAYHGSHVRGLKPHQISTRNAIETRGTVFAASNEDAAGTFTIPREYGEPMFYDEAGREIKPGKVHRLTLDPHNVYEVPAADAQRFIDDTTFQGQVIEDARRKGHDLVVARNVQEGIGERYPGDVFAILNDSVIRRPKK